MSANGPAHRRRANGVRLPTETQSRRSVQLVCSAFTIDVRFLIQTFRSSHTVFFNDGTILLRSPRPPQFPRAVLSGARNLEMIDGGVALFANLIECCRIWIVKSGDLGCVGKLILLRPPGELAFPPKEASRNKVYGVCARVGWMI
jgi:hypothetical protein